MCFVRMPSRLYNQARLLSASGVMEARGDGFGYGDSSRRSAVAGEHGGFLSPCCMDRRYGRIEPYPCSGLCGADILGASEVQHSVQYVGGDGHLARLTLVCLEA